MPDGLNLASPDGFNETRQLEMGRQPVGDTGFCSGKFRGGRLKKAREISRTISSVMLCMA